MSSRRTKTPTRKTHSTLPAVESHAAAVQRVACYVRVSTEDQAQSGLGSAAQVRQCQGLCLAKGWDAPVFYRDEGISGTKESRPQFDLLQAAIVARQVDAVLVASLDRIGRKTHIILDFAKLCADAGVAFVSVKESFDTSTPAGQFALTLFAGLAQMERDTISLRTVAALDERGVKYDYKSGMLPMGYRRVVDLAADGKTILDEWIEIDEARATVVRDIFRLHRRGMSYYAIAQSLNRRNIPARRGGKWYVPSVKMILSNIALYHGVHDSYPALL